MVVAAGLAAGIAVGIAVICHGQCRGVTWDLTFFTVELAVTYREGLPWRLLQRGGLVCTTLRWRYWAKIANKIPGS